MADCTTRTDDGREVAYLGCWVLFADGSEVDSLWVHEGHTDADIAEEKAFMEASEEGTLTWAEGWL